jgi:hypothetical protein
MSELLRQVYVSSSEYSPDQKVKVETIATKMKRSETKVSYSRVARFSNKKFHFG